VRNRCTIGRMSRIKRRLTTLLMEANETGTLGTLRRFRAAMAALVERHDGRIVNTWGDAVLAEFSSVVEAVQCAVEVQQEFLVENDLLPDAERMRFRIGINVGDVMVEDESIYGEGVNIAARLRICCGTRHAPVVGPYRNAIRIQGPMAATGWLTQAPP
jgi:adenylate cyclase